MKNVVRMLGAIWPFLLLLGCGHATDQQPLVRGMVLRSSEDLRPGTYLVPGDEGDSGAVVTVLGRDVMLDFQGAVLQGLSDQSNDTIRKGIGICIDQATNVSIRNLTIRGYHVGIQCKSCMELNLVNVDIEDNDIPLEETHLP